MDSNAEPRERLGAASGLLVIAAGLAACASQAPHDGFTDTSEAGSVDAGADTAPTGKGGGFSLTNDEGGATQTFDVEPTALQTVTVAAGQMTPTLTYNATLNGSPIAVGWGVNKGNIGIVPAGPSSAGVFTPSGTTGGLVTLQASHGGKTEDRQVLVKLAAQQNGATAGEQSQVPTTVTQLTAGGGVGGVGGEGLGPAVTGMPTLAALGAPVGDGQAQGLTFLYPYDKTVWPRGLPAPLVMWNWSPGDADAIAIGLRSTSGSFSWSGTFARPSILQKTGGKFIRHPIPQDVWEMATNTAGGLSDQLTLSLTVAAGGKAYGPVSETWTVAPGRPSGVIYYNSYGTALAKNATGAVGGDHTFGGAVLSIHVGDQGPALVAGGNGDSSQCRVCHSVSANGSQLWVQQGDDVGDYAQSILYNVSATGSGPGTVLSQSSWFPGLSPDGSMALTNEALLLPLPDDTNTLNATGLDQFSSLGAPAVSPNGQLAAFTPVNATTTSAQELYVMSFDELTGNFTNPTLVVEDGSQPAFTRPGWPAFFPDSNSIIFHHQSVASLEPWDSIVTRAGARAQIAWTSLDGPADVTPLDQLNGKGYLPTLAAPIQMSCLIDPAPNGTPPRTGFEVGNITPDHSDDADMNYEPTVNPVATGGYAWVVFTSRRMYGSEAVIPPFCSDPRYVDLVENITPKKLWVAAVDLTQAPGIDASHPAFYLPAQELLAGNARAFWVLDPCRAYGKSCQSGDQCCSGYCEPTGTMNALLCANPAPGGACSGLGNKCSSAADCCDPTNACIDGYCTTQAPAQ